MKLIISALFFTLLSLSSFSQGVQNLKLSYGNNRTEYKTGFLEKTLLPNNKVAEDLKINSFNTDGFSFGATLGFAISKDKKWMFNTGLFYQNFDLATSIYAYSEGTDYIFRRATKVNQLELPLLVSWRNSDKKFRYGGDFGLIKALAVWSKYQEYGVTSGIGIEQKFDSYSYDLSGPVNLLEKYSFYFAPSIGYDFTKKLGIEFQPYFRYQIGNESQSWYSNSNGAPVIQYGINLNLVKYF
ncbi:hypothetical protein SAMN03080617_01945 [Algoriphagus alkaliphilus]|uniref:Outer membrane protein beta-barrel domain-containing protein n=1 Tax=Algoriphagus alkaliphilus TaxID=279824 RepID=A0A1G5XSS4_9BACT|nr:outer membrane beta-barrel protein [Algoriphagus alkaliphilus]MBA4301900.1 hypothetical protein [Cyclobacterium sp.]SDA72645.1 hypothetical protein SAMN03080617_01945 [Algoriphagus alkaliphilus]